MDRSMQVLLLLALASIGGGSSSIYVKGGGVVHIQQMPDCKVVGREEWGAQPPKDTAELANPVPYVIIHHSYIPGDCETEEECIDAMQSMQKMHQDTNGWDDIGYNFAIGGDGNIYQGRGWHHQGAHAPTYNNQSIGICMIGDWTAAKPPPQMLERAHELIAYGVQQRHISTAYELYTHRQVRAGTECPGDALHAEAATWPHWGATPPRRYQPPVQ